jgi:serine/threonine protein kinase
VYKLTDFGAAKQVQPDEQFYSIIGTEEYLFPEMYARTFYLPCDMNQPLTPDIDLWSIGATMLPLVKYRSDHLVEEIINVNNLDSLGLLFRKEEM